MSIGTSHAVSILTASSKALDDTQRLVETHFKTPSDKKDDKTYKKPAARCVSIPKLQVAVEPAAVQAALQTAFEELQDAVVRSIIVSALAASKDGNPSIEITDADVSYEGVAAYAANAALSGKLSKAVLAAWFDASLAESLELALHTALKYPEQPTEEQAKKLAAAIAQHKVLITGLANPKAAMPENIVKQLQKAVATSSDDSKVRQQIDAKLQAFLTPAEVTLDIGLGE